MKRIFFTYLVLMLAVWPGGRAVSGQIVEENGIPCVLNATLPHMGNEVIALEEVWRHGGDNDEDFFGMISQCVVGPDGVIYLLDTRLSQIPVYSRDGTRMGTLSREGNGPGETRIPANLFFMPDGKLGIVQVFPGKIITIGTDGTPGPVISFGDPTSGGFIQVFDCVSDGKNLVVVAEAINHDGQSGQNRENTVAINDSEGKEIRRLKTISYHWDFTNFTWNEVDPSRIGFRRVAAGPDGRVYIASERNTYHIEVYRPDGHLDLWP